jgi:hypothetical protein
VTEHWTDGLATTHTIKIVPVDQYDPSPHLVALYCVPGRTVALVQDRNGFQHFVRDEAD